MLRWEDPPRTTVSWKAIAEELREQPGRWARVMDPTVETKANVAYKQLRKWGCEVVLRKVADKGHGVWARWPSQLSAVQPQPSAPINTATFRESIVA